MKRLLLIVAALPIVVGALFLLSRSRSFQLFGTIVPRVDTDRKVVALTFDDGPAVEHTPEVLALLRARDVRASFFLIGRDMEASPAAARAIVAAGHEVGNHSYSHKRMVLRTPAFVRREIETTDALIRAAGHRGAIHFRAPYCKKLLALPWYLRSHDRTHVTFDVEPESDPAVEGNAGRITEFVLRKARPGSIILLHPMYRGRDESRKAILPIIDGLRRRGFEFVTVSELLAADPS